MITNLAKNLTNNVISGINKTIILIILSLMLLGLGFAFFSNHSSDTTAKIRNLIITELQNMDELTTASQVGKATVILQQKKKLWKLPIGNTNLVYEGVGKIRAGFKLTDISVRDVNMTERSIHVILPPPTIQDISLDVSRSNTLANYRHWFAPKSSSELHEQAQQQAIASLTTEACENHILEAANINAQQLIRTILTEAKFQTIQIDTHLPKDNSCPIVGNKA